MKKKIFNLIIIDESGSMMGIKQEAIDSVNETIQTIRAAQAKSDDHEQIVSIVTFNDEMKTICDCVSADKAKEFSDESYQPGCCTALYDAMGHSMNKLRKTVEEGDKVLVTIVTDGYENASNEYDAASISKLVSELKDKGWVFAYIGANHDVTKAASTISITNVMHFEASSSGTRAMSDKVNNCRMRLYERMSQENFNIIEANEDFFNL